MAKVLVAEKIAHIGVAKLRHAGHEVDVRTGMSPDELLFEGEQHGFHQADNIVPALEAELSFFAQILGFNLADNIPPVPIRR